VEERVERLEQKVLVEKAPPTYDIRCPPHME